MKQFKHNDNLAPISKYIILEIILMLLPIMIYIYLEIKFTLALVDYIEFVGATLTYISTTILGVIAVYQSQQANKMSKLMLKQNEREYMVSFVISQIYTKTVHNCQSSNYHKINFCDVDYAPDSCHEIEFTIQNCSRHPITNIEIDHIHTTGKTGLVETITKPKNIIIPPNEMQTIVVCDVTGVYNDLFKNKFAIRCKNNFGHVSAILIELENADFDGGCADFSCRMLEKEDDMNDDQL